MEVAPYFDVLLEQLQRPGSPAAAAFGRHVHWGYWDEPDAADGTADDYGRAAARLCVEVCRDAGIEDGRRVLDVGCGFGGTIARLNETQRSLDMVGLNLDPRQLRRAAEQVRPLGDNRIAWVEGDACRMPLPVEPAFDVVLAVECIFHFPSRAEFFREAAARLRPGGRLALSDFVPPERVAAFLAEPGGAAPGGESLRHSYGQVDILATESRYRELADAVGLRLFVSRDVTSHTLPTYDFLRAQLGAWDDRELARRFDESTRQLQRASRKGLLEYRILTFERIAARGGPTGAQEERATKGFEGDRP